MSWSEAADAAQLVLADQFWHPRFGIYQRTPGRRRFAVRLEWDYWIQAHALDVTVDAAARTGSTDLHERIRTHVAGILRRDPGADVTTLCKTLLEAARDFATGPLTDDVAILAIRRT